MRLKVAQPIDAVIADESWEGDGGQQPNLAPLLDAIFLIIAVLLVALIQMTAVEGLPAWTLGGNDRPTTQEPTQRVEVVISGEGLPMVDGAPTAVENLAAAIDRIESAGTVDAVYLLANTEVSYGTVVEALMRLQRPGHPPVYLGVDTAPVSMEE